MNFSSERNKPIFVARPIELSARNSAEMVNEVIANRSIVRAQFSNDYVVKANAAHRLRRSSFVTVDESTETEVKELVIARLESDGTEKFQFMDGRVFSGGEAAQEVSKGTEVGRYFLELEKETLRIVQQAFDRGEI